MSGAWPDRNTTNEHMIAYSGIGPKPDEESLTLLRASLIGNTYIKLWGIAGSRNVNGKPWTFQFMRAFLSTSRT